MVDRGIKRKCSSCGISYYDLNRSPVTCPKCGAAYVHAAPTRPSRRMAQAAAPVVAEVDIEPAGEDVELEPIGDEFEETEDLPADEDTFVTPGGDDDEHQ